MRINIVGRGGSWGLCPNNKDHVMWCLANIGERAMSFGYSPDKIFQLHDESLFEPYLERCQRKVVLMRPSKKLPLATVLPAESLISSFGKRMSSSIGWMMAWAMNLSPEEIGIYGVDMKDSFEYLAQRDLMFYMIGRAEAVGIKVLTEHSRGLHYDDKTYELREGDI
jgi:hypothetical protein